MSRYTKRPDGRYMTHVTVGTNEDGKPKRKTIYAKTIRELEEKSAEVRLQVTNVTLVSDDKVLVSDWAVEWLNTYKTGVERNTYKMYSHIVKVHLVPALGQMKIKDVRSSHVQKLVNEKAVLDKTVDKQ